MIAKSKGDGWRQKIWVWEAVGVLSTRLEQLVLRSIRHFHLLYALWFYLGVSFRTCCKFLHVFFFFRFWESATSHLFFFGFWLISIFFFSPPLPHSGSPVSTLCFLPSPFPSLAFFHTPPPSLAFLTCLNPQGGPPLSPGSSLARQRVVGRERIGWLVCVARGC